MSTVHDAVKSTELLYRLRTAEGELLYVGITRNWPQRMTQHQADKPWWSDVRDIEIVAVLGTRQQVEAIEKAVIKTEAPTYNKTHAVRVMTAPKVTSGPYVIAALRDHQAAVLLWQVNEGDGRCRLLAGVGRWLHHNTLGWGEVTNIAEGDKWWTTIDFGHHEGSHTVSIFDPSLRDPDTDEAFEPPVMEDDGIPKLYIGSNCYHSDHGPGTVIQTAHQLEFLVTFTVGRQAWIRRDDPNVAWWAQ